MQHLAVIAINVGGVYNKGRIRAESLGASVFRRRSADRRTRFARRCLFKARNRAEICSNTSVLRGVNLKFFTRIKSARSTATASELISREMRLIYIRHGIRLAIAATLYIIISHVAPCNLPRDCTPRLKDAFFGSLTCVCRTRVSRGIKSTARACRSK